MRTLKTTICLMFVCFYGVATAMASEDKLEEAFHVNYKLMYGRDVQNMFSITNAPSTSDSKDYWDVYAFGSIQQGLKKMKGGRQMVEIKFFSSSHNGLNGTTPGTWVSPLRPLFFLVHLGSYRGELADLDVQYETSILMSK